jgi:hypothetical protein
MQYRKYGRTEVAVSEIGLGGHREGAEFGSGVRTTSRYFLPAQERARVVGRAIDLGVTYFDTTYGCELASLGESLRLLGKRDGLFVSGMRVDFFKNLLNDEADARTYTRREVELRLREFGFDYLDQFLLGALDFSDPLSHPPAQMDEAFAELEDLKAEGKVRFVGFSCHDPNYAARLLDRYRHLDAAMVPYNFLNRAAEGEFAAAIARTGAAWIAMKPLVWRVYGIPITALRRLRPVPGRLEFDPEAPIAQLALRFLLDNPAVTTCVPAVNTIAEVEEDVPASDRDPLTEAEQRELARYAEASGVEDSLLLALAGLHVDNLRVRACALRHVAPELASRQTPDPSADDAEEQARRAAEETLAAVKQDPRWAELL